MRSIVPCIVGLTLRSTYPLAVSLPSALIGDVLRLVKSAKECPGFVQTLLVFSGGIGISHNATAGLNIGTAIYNDHRAQGNGCLLVPRVTEVPNCSSVDTALLSLKFADDHHRTY